MMVFIDDTDENCALLSPYWGVYWNDWDCVVPKGVPIKCGCEKHRPVYLRMRGLCEDSNLDVYWVPGNANHEIFYIGFTTSKIDYDQSLEKWLYSGEGTAKKTTAYTESTFHSFILGRSDWIIENDCK